MDKDVACVCNQILFNHRKEGNSAICDNIDDPWQHCAQWNKSAEKDKYCMISFIRVTKKSKQMNKHKKTEAEL